MLLRQGARKKLSYRQPSVNDKKIVRALDLPVERLLLAGCEHS